MVVSSMPLPFAGNPNFVNTLLLYTFNIQFMYDNLFLFFCFFTMKQIASIFCNVTFAGQYIFLGLSLFFFRALHMECPKVYSRFYCRHLSDFSICADTDYVQCKFMTLSNMTLTLIKVQRSYFYIWVFPVIHQGVLRFLLHHHLSNSYNITMITYCIFFQFFLSVWMT